MQKELRKKRNEFLLGIINQFQQSDEPKTIFDCYDYVKTITNLQIDDFLKTLSGEEKKMIESKFDLWFLPLETIRTFSVFLSNNGIKLENF
ncbi:MAG: hypothetical protein ACI7YS_18370 [Flavobacterium sp.]